MTDELTPTDGDCGYCGHRLDSRVYFCPACSRPYRSVELSLTPSAPRFENVETSLRTGAPDVWTAFFAFLSVLVISGTLGMAIWGYDNQEPTLLLSSFALFVLTAFGLFRYWNDVKPLLVKSGFLSPVAWIGLLALAPLLLLNYGYHSMLSNFMEAEADDYSEIFSIAAGSIVFVCILPAIVEEIAFRGIIQHRLESVVSPWIAITAASALFSVAHFSLYSAPYLAAVGFLLGWMKWKTGSLYPCMVAHFIHNYIVVTYFDS